MADWIPIEKLTKEDCKRQLFLGHSIKKWVRFGRMLPGHGTRWYYSGTNERNQYAQTLGDEPTHYMPMIAAPE